MRGKSNAAEPGPIVFAISNGSFEGLKEVGRRAREPSEELKEIKREGRILARMNSSKVACA